MSSEPTPPVASPTVERVSDEQIVDLRSFVRKGVSCSGCPSDYADIDAALAELQQRRAGDRDRRTIIIYYDKVPLVLARVGPIYDPDSTLAYYSKEFAMERERLTASVPLATVDVSAALATLTGE